MPTRIADIAALAKKLQRIVQVHSDRRVGVLLRNEDARCGRCNGTGEVDYYVEVSGRPFAPRYFEIVAALGDVRCAPTYRDGAMLFRFDGGEGLLMQLARDNP